MRRLRSSSLIALVLVMSARFASAHDPGLSSAEITMSSAVIDARVTFNSRDLDAIDSKPEAVTNEVLELRQENHSLPLQWQSVEVDPAQNTTFALRFAAATGTKTLHVRSGIIGWLPNGHRQLISVRNAAGQNVAERLITAKEDSFGIDLPNAGAERAPGRVRFGEFLLLGVEHILTGYDHLLFLTGILIVCSSFVAAARIITWFTIAHSMSLALATFNVVALPGRIVEPMIAASIFYVGVENFWKGGTLRWRELLTFAFGLVHGLGFASALREAGIGTSGAGVAIPLFSFNLGVEMGQLLLAACLLPVVLRLRCTGRLPRFAIPVVSLFIAGAGAFWFCQRLAA